jgi:hypothetical protein
MAILATLPKTFERTPFNSTVSPNIANIAKNTRTGETVPALGNLEDELRLGYE